MVNTKLIEPLLKQVRDKSKLLEFLSEFMTEERSIRFDEILKYRTRHFTIAIEDIDKERNACAVMRSCDCFGIQDIHIIENRNKYKIVEDITKGSEKWVSAKVYDGNNNNTELCINRLKKEGYRIICTSPHKKNHTLDTIDISNKTAIFLGGERDGLSETALSLADDFLYIPMVGFTESFNISVAGAIILYDLTTRLKQSKIPWGLSDAEKLELKLDWTIKTIFSSKSLIKKYLAIQ